MKEYPDNSISSKEDQKKKVVKKVVTTDVTVKKKTFGKKLLNNLVSEDIPDLKTYVVEDVLIPKLTDSVYELASGALDALFGKKHRPRSTLSQGSRISYASYYKSDRRETKPLRSSAYDYADISFTTKSEAEEVLSQLEDILEAYDVVNIADYYDTVGLTPKHTDYKYGWYDLRGATIRKDRDGYYLKLPNPKPID